MKKNEMDKRMDEYRVYLKNLLPTQLLDEWEKVRKVLNPDCIMRKVEEKEESVDIVVQQKKEEPVPMQVPVCQECPFCFVSKPEGERQEFFCTKRTAAKHNACPVTTPNGRMYFICYGKKNTHAPQTKTSPRWCPRRWCE